ncbi:MAG TPA: mechanosensitive ion channel domain-containing protein [Polyangiales bacterium]
MHRAPLRILILATIGWLTVAAHAAAQATPWPLPARRDQALAALTSASEIRQTPESPRGSLWAYFAATRAGQWNEAARYLLLSDAQAPRGAQLARRLKGVIDGHHWIDLETVSADPAARLDDGLPADLEEVSTLDVQGHTEPIRMIRTSDARGAFWAFSPSTVDRIDHWYALLPDRWVRDLLVELRLDALLRTGPAELLLWQWVALPILVALALLMGATLGKVSRVLLRRVVAGADHARAGHALDSFSAPLVCLWSIAAFTFCTRVLSLTDPARVALGKVVLAGLLLTLFWTLRRSIALFSVRVEQLSWAAANPSARHLLAIGTNLARGMLVVLAVLTMLWALGYPVGALLAGLGIGGLALAFGAQKTIENLFGTVSLAIDQPMRVGDMVKIDDFVGTVEDIGLRSTRVRTLDRTLVSIPNGKLAEQRLESLAARDRMRLFARITLTYSTSRAQMEAVIAGFEQVLKNHPQVWKDVMLVKLAELGDSALVVEVMAWFSVSTLVDFQVCRQQVLLDFMHVVESAGTSFAFPTRTVHLETTRPS